MTIKIEEIISSRLAEYRSVPIRFEVKSVLEPKLVNNGLGGILLHETPVETQNTHVPACRFYQRMGASGGEIHRFVYATVPKEAHEVMLCWYPDLTIFCAITEWEPERVILRISFRE